MRPTVGITAATETINYGDWQDVPAFMSPANYVRAVQRAGGRPVLLIPDEEDTENPTEVLDLVDAVIITPAAPETSTRNSTIRSLTQRQGPSKKSATPTNSPL